MAPKRPQTPLEREADKLRLINERRKEAIKAAQQYALRGKLDNVRSGSSALSTSASAPTASTPPPAPPDFDTVRQALRDKKHKQFEAKKRAGAT